MNETDDSEPNEELMVAARGGDLSAIRELAEWHRRRGRPADNEFWDDSDAEVALQLDCYACELHEREYQARKLRRLLALLPRDEPAFGATRRATRDDLRRHADRHGLPVKIYGAMMAPCVVAGGTPNEPATELRLLYGEGVSDREATSYYVVVPTDGKDEEQTKALLLAFFGRAFERITSYEIVLRNDPISACGEEALDVLGLRDG